MEATEERNGGSAPTLGVIGRLRFGAKTGRIGFVSDGDGALTVLAAAAKLLSMQEKGDQLPRRCGNRYTFVPTHRPNRMNLLISWIHRSAWNSATRGDYRRYGCNPDGGYHQETDVINHKDLPFPRP